MTSTTEPGFGLYVHWPFCLSKCPYCDFNSHVRAKIDAEAWSKALRRELQSMSARLDQRSPLNSVFFGGGTPSLMPGFIVAGILEEAERIFGFAPDIEITLEANPTSVEAQRFQDYRAAGVNRVSLGVQSLDDEELRRLGRLHTSDEALKAVALAQSIFPRASIDLIYARPNQTPERWQSELAQALAQGCTHYSLYQLTFEDGTPYFEAMKRGAIKPLDDERSAELYEATQRQMEAAGLPAYEISNHARPGQESRHNLIYWRYGDYLGIGPGAHGRVAIDGQRMATATIRSPEGWLAAVNKNGNALSQAETVANEDAGKECLLMGLRLREGLSRGRVESLLGRPLSTHHALDAGLIETEGDRLRATPRGRLVLNAVIKELLR
ncbi:MAG: coproporphyrinogen III oxidase [Alphaproteobacteria bacterium]|nr:coproporphyrinogen III oxidase [Alphaproteobacteria bacterium]